MPTAPEVPRPVQADPGGTGSGGADQGGTARDGTDASPPPYPIPGAPPPAYPGWESASDTPAPPGGPYGGPAPGAHRGPAGDDFSTGNPPGTSPYGPYGSVPPSGAPAGAPAGPSQQPPPYAASPGGPPYPPQGNLAYPSGQPYQGQPPPYPGYPGGTPYPPPPGSDWSRRQGGGLGTTALVLGIVSLFLLVVCGLGVLTAIAGLIVGIVAVVKNSNRGRAWVGIVLSALTLIIAAVLLSWLYSRIGDCAGLPAELQQRCIEQRLGVQIQSNP
ncbi:hypothetical protein FHR32_002393 [Streptosporangium album]|uniref:DUF4190 domain-containing protein n=1 Tax=Streptosporangium album TaxID=47479 RepID=A0A7W7RTU3_9ACTN|nr:DUF4190 domain-containing protein [Streptosporangium album]MBB4938088.1 hypothetical protein [Streptosporangium album]